MRAKGIEFAKVCGLAVIFSAFAAQAVESPKRAPVMQEVLDCRAVADNTQRLACFDKAVGTLAQADQTGDLITIDREQRRTVRRQAFGLSLPSLSMFDRGEKVEENDHIAVTVSHAERNNAGKWVVVLDDGAVWRQIDSEPLDASPKAGQKAVIRRAALGSFMLKLAGESSIRVHRDN